MNINTKDLIKIIEINTLVISGGGMKGYLFIGCIKLLFELNIIKRIKYFYGTSIGGFLIVLLSLGWNIDDIMKIGLNFSIGSIIDFDIDYFINNYAIVPKINFETLIKKIISYKGFDPEITFEKLYELTSKEVNLIAFSFKNNTSIVMNHINTPNIMLWEGLYMTAALPVLITPYLHDNDAFIDGGLYENFPIDKVKYENRSKTIGICASPYKPEWVEIEKFIIEKDIINYALELIKIVFNRRQKTINQNFIELQNCAIDTFNFKMDSDSRGKLINFGYEQSIIHIDRLITNLYYEQTIPNRQIYNKFSIYNEI